MLERKVERIGTPGEAQLIQHQGRSGVLNEQIDVRERLQHVGCRMRGGGLKHRCQRAAGSRVRLGCKEGVDSRECAILNHHRCGLAAGRHASALHLQPIHAGGGGLRVRQTIARRRRAAERHAVPVPLIGWSRAGPKGPAGGQLEQTARSEAPRLGLARPLCQRHGTCRHVVYEQLVDPKVCRLEVWEDQAQRRPKHRAAQAPVLMHPHLDCIVTDHARRGGRVLHVSKLAVIVSTPGPQGSVHPKRQPLVIPLAGVHRTPDNTTAGHRNLPNLPGPALSHLMHPPLAVHRERKHIGSEALPIGTRTQPARGVLRLPAVVKQPPTTASAHSLPGPEGSILPQRHCISRTRARRLPAPRLHHVKSALGRALRHSRPHCIVTPQRPVPLQGNHHLSPGAHRSPVPHCANQRRRRFHVRLERIDTPERDKIHRSRPAKSRRLPKLVPRDLLHFRGSGRPAPIPGGSVFFDGATAVSARKDAHPVGGRTDPRGGTPPRITRGYGRKGKLPVLVVSPAPEGSVVLERQRVGGPCGNALPVVGSHRAAASDYDPGLLPDVRGSSASRDDGADAHRRAGLDLSGPGRNLKQGRLGPQPRGAEAHKETEQESP